MDSDREMAFTPTWQLRQFIDSGKISPVELMELFLARIANMDPALNAYLAVYSGEARRQAWAAQDATARGGLRRGSPLGGSLPAIFVRARAS